MANRYQSSSISSPRRASRDWNRTFELTPTAVRGGALLIHGLTDGPYSMRAVAEHAARAGLLRARAPHARPRHRAWRADASHRRGLDGGGPDGRPSRAPDHRRGPPDGPGRLLQRRRPRGALRARSRGGLAAARPFAPRADFADDRRFAARAHGARDQRAWDRCRSSRRLGGWRSCRNTTRSSTTRFRPTRRTRATACRPWFVRRSPPPRKAD